jgi:hypothetical protein
MNSLTFTPGVQLDQELQNFWSPEDGFVWSSGKWCEVGFSFDAGAGKVDLCDLILDIDVFRHNEDLKGQNVLFFFNGLRIGSLYCTKRSTIVFSFPGIQLKSAENVLTIDTPDASSPAQFGSKDGRMLGIQLFSMQIRKVDQR